jgi:hypothetical protein
MHLSIYSYVGCVVTQAVSCRVPTTTAQVRARLRSNGTCVGQMSTMYD